MDSSEEGLEVASYKISCEGETNVHLEVTWEMPGNIVKLSIKLVQLVTAVVPQYSGWAYKILLYCFLL